MSEINSNTQSMGPQATSEIKRPTTRSIYLLSYDNAMKVIDFIRRNDTGAMDSDYACISPGCVHTQVNDENWPAVVAFLNELDVRYEAMDANNLVAKSNGGRKNAKPGNQRNILKSKNK